MDSTMWRQFAVETRRAITSTRVGLFAVGVLGLLLITPAGCVSSTKRVGLDDLSDFELGTGLTSQDFRSIAQRMARSLIAIPEIQKADTPPTVALISVSNESNHYINGDMFLDKMTTELIKHSNGRVRFLDREIISAIEQENRDKAAGERTSNGQQTPYGADFFLTGKITSIDKAAGRGSTGYIVYTFRLTNAATSVIVWKDDYPIKKYSRRGIMND